MITGILCDQDKIKDKRFKDTFHAENKYPDDSLFFNRQKQFLPKLEFYKYHLLQGRFFLIANASIYPPNIVRNILHIS